VDKVTRQTGVNKGVTLVRVTRPTGVARGVTLVNKGFSGLVDTESTRGPGTESPSSSESTNICNVTIEGIDTKGLVDTGAGICLISETFRQQNTILKRRRLNTAISLRATSVNEEPVDLRVEVTFPYYVARNMSQPVLIGRNFIQSQGAVVDGKNGKVVIGAERIPFLPRWRVFPRVCSAYMESTMTIPPRCEIFGRGWKL
jgi:hypothetical protein